MKSILISMIDGYLVVNRCYDQPWHKNYRASESNRIAAKIRDTFGQFDESDQGRCASVIRAVMKSEPEPRPKQPKRNAQPERDRWEKRVLAEAKTRQEREERLKNIEWF